MKKLIQAGILILFLGYGGYSGFIAITKLSIEAILASIISFAMAVSFLLYIRPKRAEAELQGGGDTDESS